jgi:putative peptidoglycan lipid II flippase
MAPRNSFIGDFLVSAAGTGFSRVLGAVRDMAIAAALGASAASDAFWIAFTIPNVFRHFVADEGLTGALIPALARAEAEEGEAAGRTLVDSLFGVLLLANLVLLIAGVVFAEQTVLAFASAYKDDPEQLALTTLMTQWMFPFLAMVSIVSFFEGLLNHRGHFLIPKIAPGVVSLAMAFSVTWLADFFPQPVLALVFGVLAGGALHVVINLPVVASRWGRLRPRLDFSPPRLRQVLRQLAIVIAIGVFAQVNILVLRQLSAALGDGQVTRYWYANRVVDLAQGVIAIAIGSALLPPISAAVAARDMAALEAALVRALSLAGFLLLPSASVLLVFSVPIVALLFGHGAFGPEDVIATAGALQMLVPFLLAVAVINLLKRVYYALDDRRPLFLLGGLGVAATLGLGLALVGPYGLTGLAMALSLSTVLQLLASGALLQRRLGPHLGVVRITRRWAVMAVATVPGMAWMAWLAQGETWLEAPASAANLLRFCAALGGAGALYLGVAWALDIEEFRLASRRIRVRFAR